MLRACPLQPSVWAWETILAGPVGEAERATGPGWPVSSTCEPNQVQMGSVHVSSPLFNHLTEFFPEAGSHPIGYLRGKRGYLHPPTPQLWKCFKCEGKWIQIGMCWEDTVGKPSVALQADTNAGLIRKSILLSGWLIAVLGWRWERVESWRDNFFLLLKGGLMYISKQFSVKNLLKTRHLFPLVNWIFGEGEEEEHSLC